MSKNKVVAPPVPQKPNNVQPQKPKTPEKRDTQVVMNEIYEKLEPDSVLRSIITSNVDQITANFSK